MLRAQHLLDATVGSIAPTVQTCLDNLTRLVNSLLSSKIDKRISPWLAGAKLTAFHKKTGGPIAVREVLHQLTSHACCCSIKSRFSDVRLWYGQVGVGPMEVLKQLFKLLRLLLKIMVMRRPSRLI